MKHPRRGPRGVARPALLVLAAALGFVRITTAQIPAPPESTQVAGPDSAKAAQPESTSVTVAPAESTHAAPSLPPAPKVAPPATVPHATASPRRAPGAVQGRILSAETGDPVGFADIVLLPADTTMKKVGGLTNADGTYRIEAPPGRYALRVRALSYAAKRLEGVIIESDRMVDLSTTLSADAIRQPEIVVEAKARENTEASVLATRRKAVALGDGVSAEQVRRSPDKDAAEVLRRVTGLSVSDGKYVYVRGLGERYSSTEVDGVRIATPEQNKRVVPLDLVPASLLENIVVQKTYTADRPGEFGGGDVQVRTRDFPGSRTWAFAFSQGAGEGVTFQDRRTYPGGGANFFRHGADTRGIPGAVYTIGGNQKLEEGAFTRSQLAQIARSFDDVWSPRSASTMPNGRCTASYGDELFRHRLGLVTSWSLSNTFDGRNESQRLFRSASADTFYDYNVDRSSQKMQLGGIAGLSWRFSPAHALHVRGLYTHDAEDEVRVYEGADHTRDEAISQTHLYHRGTRLLYIERQVLSGALEGDHHFKSLANLGFDWKVTRSQARRQQPDRREVIYDRRYYFEGDTAHWLIGSQGNREYGDLHDSGWGTTLSGSLPYTLAARPGKLLFGYDVQTKKRDNFYRRFQLIHSSDPGLWESPPDTLFDQGTFDGGPSTGYVVEKTFTDSRFTDNYRASQRVDAGYASVDVPMSGRVRGSFGVRAEKSLQDVQSFDLFHPDSVLQEGSLDDLDWLPSVNVTIGFTKSANLRLAASRTLSRPDLNELSPSPTIEYEGGSLVLGNPNLRRARIDNYDVRVEAFPGLSEVLAAGFFYKRLHQPIELVIQGSADPLVYPKNSDQGRNLGMEVELRSSLARVWRRMNGLSLNANGSLISSAVDVNTTSQNGSQRHPLQGQANYLVNAAVTYASASAGREVSVLVSSTGKRLYALGYRPLPDIYEQPVTMLDATLAWRLFRVARLKVAARNLLDPRIQQLQGTREVSGYRLGRSFGFEIAVGS